MDVTSQTGEKENKKIKLVWKCLKPALLIRAPGGDTSCYKKKKRSWIVWKSIRK